jgi:Rrf2 family protein
MLSKTSQHAIRAMVAIAQRREGGFVTAKAVSEALGLPPSFLAKVLQRLTSAGLLDSLRGPTGGVALARPAESIRLVDIVEAIDGRVPFESCLFGWPGCSSDRPCPLHREWGKALQPVLELLETATLADTTELVTNGEAEHGLLHAAI